MQEVGEDFRQFIKFELLLLEVVSWMEPLDIHPLTAFFQAKVSGSRGRSDDSTRNGEAEAAELAFRWPVSARPLPPAQPAAATRAALSSSTSQRRC